MISHFSLQSATGSRRAEKKEKTHLVLPGVLKKLAGLRTGQDAGLQSKERKKQVGVRG
jgi:hypothetical protein